MARTVPHVWVLERWSERFGRWEATEHCERNRVHARLQRKEARRREKAAFFRLRLYRDAGVTG